MALLISLFSAGTGTGQEAPELEFDLLTPDTLEISWEDEGGAYQLETSLDLEDWITLRGIPSLLLGRYKLLVPTALERNFFRLRGTVPSLYVVNATDDFTSYAHFQTADGAVPPTTRLSIGATTGLTQPRTVAVTKTGRLLISRGNGGILGWNDATTADGTDQPDVTIDGPATGLVQPIAFAYDPQADRLFVGNTVSDLGILVFDNVSSFLFDGDVAPHRAFGPNDRVPFNGGANTIKMTIDALTLDGGTLYAVDTSGANLNSSRIMVYTNPATANGQANPARTITGPWTKIRSIDVHNNRLYAVDDSNVLFLINNISSASGLINPTRVTIEGSVVALRAVGVFHGQTYFLDENNAAILAIAEVLDGSDTSVAPDRAIEGFATRLRLPTSFFITPGFLGP